jgi:hypothetical protein
MALAVGFALGMALSRNGASAADEQQAAHDAHGDAHGGAHGSAAGGAPGGHSKHWAPVDDIHLYLCAFHVAKENPKFQVEAHHFCNQHKDVHQCLIYESNEKNARLLGVEYIIGHEAYQKLPDDEKKYWHPHAYEIMSGQLIAPDLPKEGDAIFPGLTETWGKTWHTWRDPATDYPLGEPVLMWSANADGQLSDTLVAKRDAKFGVKTAEIRERRKAFGWAVPQLQPAKLEESGRKWTPTGDDKPVPLDKGRAAAIRVQ